MRISNIIVCVGLMIFVFSCSSDPIPKPKGYVRLEYPEAHYVLYQSNNCPFEFQVSDQVELIQKSNCWIDLTYPKMNSKLYLTYYALQGDLANQIKQSEDMIFRKHTQKASGIKPEFFQNEEARTFGTIFKLKGEAASNIQFYLTDSIHHFISGSLYFRTTPNGDSLAPAVEYIEKDIKVLMETFRWR